MHRTTIMLPRDLKMRAERLAKGTGISLGELIRRSLETVVAQPGAIADDSLFRDRAVYGGEVPPGYTTDHDDHLYGDGQ